MTPPTTSAPTSTSASSSTTTGFLSALRHVARPLPAERDTVTAFPASRSSAVVVLPAPRRPQD